MPQQIDIRNLGGWPKKVVLQHRADIIHAVRVTVRAHAPGMLQSAIDSYGDRKPVSSGEYRRSWKFADEPGGIVVYNPTIQAGIVEHGRRAAPVSREGREALARWVHLHGMDRAPLGKRERAYRRKTRSALAGTGEFRKRDKAIMERRAMAIAFLIARSMARMARPARPVLKPVRIMLLRLVVAAVNRRVYGSGTP